jgi:hypothetical protein
MSLALRAEIRTISLALAGAEHLHRGLIRMQHILLQDFLMECVDQRLQLYAARAQPAVQAVDLRDLLTTANGQTAARCGQRPPSNSQSHDRRHTDAQQTIKMGSGSGSYRVHDDARRGRPLRERIAGALALTCPINPLQTGKRCPKAALT